MFSTIAYVGIIITALAIKLDEYTQFTHPSLPVAAFIGVLTIVLSLVL